MTQIAERGLYDVREAATWLSISTRSVFNLIAAGEIKTRRIGRRRLIPKAELEKLARRDSQTQPAA